MSDEHRCWSGNGNTGRVAAAQQRLNVDPARSVERDAGFLRLMPQDKAEKFAEPYVIRQRWNLSMD